MESAAWENIRADHLQAVESRERLFRRPLIDEIDWSDRLIFILGARGVGKTTMICEHLHESFGSDPSALYVSMDSLSVIDIRLIDIAIAHHERGGTHLFIDEIHKYPQWSLELKNIHDRYRKLRVVASGSNILEIQKGKADLSRRGVDYYLHGLSFREFIEIESGVELPSIGLQDLLEGHVDFAQEIQRKVKPLQYWDDYLRFGFYPFYLENRKSYSRKLNNILNLTLEIDLPQLLGVDVSKVDKIKKLIYILTTQVPFIPNVTKLSETLGLDRATLTTYLQYLEKASIACLLWNKGKSYSLLTKPDKIYLHNTNLYYLTRSQINTGTLRECFFASQLSGRHELRLAEKGDFIVDDRYIIEVGGKKKRYKQIADLPDSYLATDDLMVGVGNRIPLWAFGFLAH